MGGCMRARPHTHRLQGVVWKAGRKAKKKGVNCLSSESEKNDCVTRPDPQWIVNCLNAIVWIIIWCEKFERTTFGSKNKQLLFFSGLSLYRCASLNLSFFHSSSSSSSSSSRWGRPSGARLWLRVRDRVSSQSHSRVSVQAERAGPAADTAQHAARHQVSVSSPPPHS